MTRQVLGLLLMAAFLAGCVSPGELRRDAEDERACTSYGFKQGTDGYAQCRLELARNRAISNSESRSSSETGQILGESVRRAMTPTSTTPQNCMSRQSYPGAPVYTTCF